LNRGNLHIAFHSRADDFDPLAAVVQTLKVQYESRLATDFQGDGGRLVRLGPNPAILFVLPTNLMQLLPYGGSVGGAVAVREGKLSDTAWGNGVLLGAEEPFDNQVRQLPTAHGRLESW
jgi:hypothetical protein